MFLGAALRIAPWSRTRAHKPTHPETFEQIAHTGWTSLIWINLVGRNWHLDFVGSFQGIQTTILTRTDSVQGLLQNAHMSLDLIL